MHESSMKAIQIKKYGSNDVVEVNETAPAPSLSSGKILVNIKASGVNPVDWKIREGYMQQIMPLGLDFSGVVKQVEEDAHSDLRSRRRAHRRDRSSRPACAAGGQPKREAPGREFD